MRTVPTVLILALLAGFGGRGAVAEEAVGTSWCWRPWARWWYANRSAYEDLRRQTLGAAPLRAKTVRDEILPALEGALRSDGTKHPDVVSCALMALAKASHDPAHLALLTRRAGLSGQPQWVEEAALLSLGLLRRTEPEAQLEVSDLDPLRELLFEALADDGRPTRARAFAAFALGLLGDQPSGLEEHASIGRQATTARLFLLLVRHVEDDELAVALLVALGQQHPESSSPDQRRLLRHLARSYRLGHEPVSKRVAVWATAALGRLGGTEGRTLLAALLRAKTRVTVEQRRAAAAALGVLGRRRPSAERVPCAAALVEGIEREPDAHVRLLALVGLAHLLRADVRDGVSTLLEDGRARARLEASLEHGSPNQQASAAIALALVLRALPRPVVRPHEIALDHAVRSALFAHLSREDIDPEARAGLSLAAGIARAGTCRPLLFEVLRDETNGPGVRAYAARGIGLLGTVSPSQAETLGTIHATTKRDVVRSATFRALALLGHPIVTAWGETAIDLARADLVPEASTSRQGQAVVRLGAEGDRRAVAPLTAVALDPKRHALVRALACLGLGHLADPERIPSLGRLRTDTSFGAGTEALYELWATL